MPTSQPWGRIRHDPMKKNQYWELSLLKDPFSIDDKMVVEILKDYKEDPRLGVEDGHIMRAL